MNSSQPFASTKEIPSAPTFRSAASSRTKTSFGRIGIALLILALLVACILFFIDDLKRLAIASAAWRAQIFTPPPALAAENRALRTWHTAQFFWDFSAYPIARMHRLKLLSPTLKPLVAEIARRQAAGEDMQYSMHIYREIRWRLNFTADVATTRARIEDLRESLSHPELQAAAGEQQPSDGSWGLGINVWYLRLYYSVEEGLKAGKPRKYPLRFLDRVNSSQKLKAQLSSDLFDYLTGTGTFNREETDETFSAIARLLFSNHPIDYPFDPGLKDSLQSFVDDWQNPSTGFWGQWIVDRHGNIWKMDDMAMTFHVVSDLKGRLKHRDMIARRLLQLDGINFPSGIRFNGHYENHLNWDAVIILRYAWPDLDEQTRQQARAEISRMLDWCLHQSYQADGSFKTSDLDDTTGDTYMYGVYFLRDVGYFNKQDRFWTDQDFPDGKSVHDRIATRVRAIGLNDPGLEEAYKTLNAVE